MATILVVDDRPTNREFLITLLGYSGHHLVEAADGQQALDRVRVERPDLVITDILMPTMDGYEFVQKLRADPVLAPTPVIFYSAAYSLLEAEALGRSCGVKTVLTKPAEPQDILDAVSRELHPESEGGAPEGGKPRNDRASGDHDRPRLTDRSLTGTLKRPRSEIDRLAALEDLSGRLIAERGPGRMLELFVEGAGLILGAGRAAVCLLDSREEGVAHLATLGLDSEVLRARALDHTRLPGALLRSVEPVRLDRFVDEAAEPRPGSSAAGAFLGLSIRMGGQLFGWMYFADRESASPFDLDDERLALSMAARVAVIYENATLYETVQHHAAQLQLAVTERERSEAELRESEQRFRQLAENIQEVFYLTDPAAAEMFYVSPAYEEIWGRSCRSLYDDPRSWALSIHPDDRERTFEVYGRMEAVGGFDIEYRIVRPDGGLRWIQTRGFPIRDEGGTIYRVAGIAADVTERKQGELELLRTNRALLMLSSCNEALIRAEEEQALLDRVCRIAVEVGGYRIARVAFAMDDAAKSLVLRAHAGDTPSFLEVLRPSWSADTPTGETPLSHSIRSGEPTLVRSLAQEPSLRKVAPEIRAAGLGSGICLPLRDAGRSFGLLALYASVGVEVGAEELALLRELADDLGFGICTIRSRAERLKADEALQASLKEKEALLKEIHHRVKNNLQVITSLLRLESNRLVEGPAQIVFKDMQNRIQSMATLHETLYRSGNFSEVDLGAYLRQLAGQLIRSLAANPDKVVIHLDLASVPLGLDQAVPCGLILNELVSNALKHGFPDGRKGVVRVELRQAASAGLLLRVSDDGVGLPPEFEQRRAKSLGLQLVTDLARQLRGRVEAGPGPGAAFVVTFPGGKDERPESGA